MKSKHFITIILLLGLLNGLLYVFVVPPWQHYDEAGHFEYSFFIAKHLRRPGLQETDMDQRLALLTALYDANFYKAEQPPNMSEAAQPYWVGQFVDPPLYYFLAAIPLRLMQDLPINTQIYAGRIVSILFLLLTIWSAYLLVKVITPQGHALQWMVPLFIALLPGLVEFMSSFTNHSAVIGIFSFWLAITTQLVKNGFRWKTFMILVGILIAGVLTQTVFYIALPLSLFALIMAVLPAPKRGLPFVVGFSGLLVLGLVAFEWTDAAFWLRRTYQLSPPRVPAETSSIPSYHVLQGIPERDDMWGVQDPTWHSGFFQLIPAQIGTDLRGKTVTLGAWMWSSANDIGAYSPGINALYIHEDQWAGFKPVRLSQTPVFVTTTVQVPENLHRLQFWIRTTSSDDIEARIYTTGVVMVEGEWSSESAPVFFDKNGKHGEWGGSPFTNLIRNSQMRQAWPYPRPRLLKVVLEEISSVNPTTYSSFLALFLDPQGTFWYLKIVATAGFETFWARFGWASVYLSTDILPRPYLGLLIVTVSGFVGVFFTQHSLTSDKHLKSYLFLVMLAVTLQAYLYGAYTMGGGMRFYAYIPLARYFFPAILVFSLILVSGWNNVFTIAQKYLKFPKYITDGIFVAFFIALNIYSIYSILTYFSAYSAG